MAREQTERRDQHQIDTGFGGADQRAREFYNQPQTRSDPSVERALVLATVDVSSLLYGIIPPFNRSENRPSSKIDAGQTREHESAIIKLKRIRNSLLNVSKLPPEVLGNIFRWNLMPSYDFWGWEVRFRDFLLVCHHWFEVASWTPELWSFWGPTLKEWKRYCRHSRSAPLNLALDDHFEGDSFDITLHDELQDRATRDAIRRVHLRAGDSELLTSIISSLTVNGEGVRSNRMESFILFNDNDTPVDISDFFDCYRFPNLRHLKLANCTTTRLDHLASRTGSLTTLSFDSTSPSLALTTSELLSILASNPTLQKVSLSVYADPSYGGHGFNFRVPLHSLEELRLSGDVREVGGVLHRLDLPNKSDLHLSLHKCGFRYISQVIGPYLRDYIGHRGTSQRGLGLFVSQSRDTIGHNIGDVDNLDPSTPAWDRVTWFASIWIHLDETPPKDLLEREILNLLSHTPQEEVTYFQAFGKPIDMAAMSARFQNLRALSFFGTPLPAIPNLGGDGEIFPALQHVFLDQVSVDSYDWSPLTTSLARRAFSGNQLDTLEISDSSHMCKEVVEEIRSVVRYFRTKPPEAQLPCPFGTCPKL